MVLQILTVGHSSGPAEDFVTLLRAAGVQAVADVRSQPSSSFAPQYNRRELTRTLVETGVQYVFLGRELGGRPNGPGMYDRDGHVLYERVAASELFSTGLRRLMSGSEKARVAMMCSEEDPTNCHRRLLIGRVLRGHGAEVLHLRGDGTIQTEAEVSAQERLRYPDRYQETLFGHEEAEWRSIRSVSGGTRRPTSSAS